MSIKRSSTVTRLMLFLSQGRAQSPASRPHLPAWPLLSPRRVGTTHWGGPSLAPPGCGSSSPSPLHKLSQSPCWGKAQCQPLLPFGADEAAQINRLKFQAARGYKGQEMLHLPDKLLSLSRRHRATYRRGKMPEVF